MPASLPLRSRANRLWLALCVCIGGAGCGAETLEVSRPNPDARRQSAAQLLGSGQNAEAEQAFREALEVDPTSIEARLGLAESARRVGDAPAAQQSWEEVLGLGADREALVTSLSGLADLRREAGDPAAAADLEAEADALRSTDR